MTGDDNMYVVDMNQFLYKNFISYESLYGLNMRAFYGKSNADSVNIFIDMNSLTKELFSRDMQFSYKDNITPIASSFINLAIHLINYYRTRHRVKAQVYLVWGENRNVNTENAPSYNAHNLQSYDSNLIIKELLSKTFDMLDTICKYLPGIYFINGGDQEVAVVIHALLDDPNKAKLFNDVPTIVYTKDSYVFQLVANNSYCFVFRPKKIRTGTGINTDGSILVDKQNLYTSYRQANRYAQIADTINDPNVSYFSLVLALTGVKDRHIGGFMRFNGACKLANAIFNHGYSANVPIDMLGGVIFDITSTKQFRGVFNISNMDSLAANYDIIDINANLNKLKYKAIYPSLFNGIVDLYSPQDVQHINDKYFVNYPLDIIGL